MPTLILPGNIFGNLTVISRSDIERDKHSEAYLCKCFCGNEKVIPARSLIYRNAKKCGLCKWRIKHPETYNTWHNMWTRCTNTNDPNYKNHGARGITVCPRWAKFTEFLKDMGDPPTDPVTGQRFTIDRIDNDKGYYKENCRWASSVVQNNNKRIFSKEVGYIARHIK